ncbi:type VII secretion protein EccE [Rugosimonospora acidiphila]|uniref:type VII secretion protein EccE n=1 Tax=Rugosimonospora acidiphila TaxID=556531 RepID=UPI0031E7112B
MPTPRQRGAAGTGRIVAAQVAVLALLLAALGRGALGWLLAAPVAAALIALGFLRWRHRWLHAWLATGLRYLARPRTVPATADPAALLAFVEPTAEIGAEPGVIEDAGGVVAVLDLGEVGTLHSGPAIPLPPPVELRAAGGCDAVQLILAAVPAGDPGPAGTSYRQLTEGRVPARCRALLAVRVSRADVSWSGEDLRRTLAGGLRRVERRLRRDGVAHRQLGGRALGAALADLAPVVPQSPAGGEGWTDLRLGGLHQASLKVPRLDRLPVEITEQLISRLLALPAASTTVGLCATTAGTDLVVRVAAGTPGGLATAVSVAHRLLGTAGVVPERLDGRQRAGLAATLPLARSLDAGRSPEVAIRAALPPSGLMLGHNRHRQPVTVRLFRPEPTLAVLLGGVPAAQVLTLRALALGARVVIQTARPRSWEPFLRAVTLPTGEVTMAPPGFAAPSAPAGPLAPQLVVLDAGRAPVPPVPAAAWRACLVLREEVSAADTAQLARADLVLLQSMPPDEGALVAAALGLGGSREWLSRIRPDLVGAVSRLGAGRSAVRWAILSLTDIERHVIGAPERVGAS